MRRRLAALPVIGSATLFVLAAIALGVSIAHSGYDPQQNRAPATRIALAAAALITAAAALRFALPAQVERPRRRGAARAGLAFLAFFLLVAWWIITLSTGST